MTITPAYATSLVRLRNELPTLVASAAIIARVPERFALGHDVMVYPWNDALAC